jgi:hypothetical protein
MATFLNFLMDVVIWGSIAIFSGIAVGLLLMFYFRKSSRKKLLKKYNPDDDKGKQAEENREVGGREQAITTASSTPARPREPPKQELLPTTDISPVGKVSARIKPFLEQRKLE